MSRVNDILNNMTESIELDKAWDNVLNYGRDIKDKRKLSDIIKDNKEISTLITQLSPKITTQINRDKVYKFYDSLGMLLRSAKSDLINQEDTNLLLKIANAYIKG